MANPRRSAAIRRDLLEAPALRAKAGPASDVSTAEVLGQAVFASRADASLLCGRIHTDCAMEAAMPGYVLARRDFVTS